MQGSKRTFLNLFSVVFDRLDNGFRRGSKVLYGLLSHRGKVVYLQRFLGAYKRWYLKGFGIRCERFLKQRISLSGPRPEKVV